MTDTNFRQRLFCEIGRFVYTFSQLEFYIRHVLAAALETHHFDAITSPYDFATLCRVTPVVFKGGADEPMAKEIQSLFSKCLELNDKRVRLVHGTWSVSEEGEEGEGRVFSARHVSRQNFEPKEYFTDIKEVSEAADEAEQLRSAIVRFLIGEPETWPSLPPPEGEHGA
jgi:hypothetical protein